MKTCGTDTVLYKLRVSSFSPSPDASSSPTKSKKYQHKTTVFNGVSANSWLLPIGICERDGGSENPPHSPKMRPKSGNTNLQPPKGTLDFKVAGSIATENEAGNETVDRDETKDFPGSGGPDGKDKDAGSATDPTRSTSNSRALTSEEFDSIWERVSQRPQHTGKIFIVSRRNFPEGINKNEYLQGKHLRSKFEVDEYAREETKVKLQPRPFTAPGKRKVGTPCSRPPRPFSHTGVRRVGDTHEKAPSRPGPLNSSLDLVITSLHFPARADSASSVRSGDSNMDKTPRHSLRPKTASATTSKSRQHGDSLSTIDSIKRDYISRAKSAPPNGRPKDTSLTLQDGGTSSHRGPSLYWRARSAYHKKVMTYGPDEGPDPNEQTQNIRGSLWRPLLVSEDGNIMQHSAGCPYKCKGCFKACLVSEDYLEKARTQKALREKEQRRQAGSYVPHGRPISVPHKYTVKINNPKNLVSIALARSQPLYQLVHGKKSSDNTDQSDTENRENADNTERDAKSECVNATEENSLATDGGATRN